MKKIVFDSGPIISLATNNLLNTLPDLKKQFKGQFCITESVREELVDRPFEIKRFKFEAFQIEALIESGVLDVVSTDNLRKLSLEVLNIANSIYQVNKTNPQLIQLGEIETLVYAVEENASAVVMDERSTRMIVESPNSLKRILEKRLHKRVDINQKALKDFKARINNIPILRSAELMSIAYEKGMLDKFLVNIPKARQNLLDAVLWGLKLNGCAISPPEIDAIMKLYSK